MIAHASSCLRLRRFLGGLAVLAAAGFFVGAGCGDSGGTAGTSSAAGGAGGGCDASRLFGTPNDKTGLDETRCAPTCACGAEPWTPEPWTDARVAALRAWTLLDPPAELTADPYATTPPPPPVGQVCGVEVVDLTARTYRVSTFESDAAAEQAGAIVTHHDACGACSSLEDLAVYAGTNDLTAPVRQCGIDTFAAGFEADVTCLEGLGFTRPCAQIWAYNTQHTRAECFSDCSALLDAAYQEPDGSLNACLACDEVKSGPVFKAVAGRTRRNTGVPSALCRPCEEVARLDHAYP